jgi:hypothetical protein
MTDDLTPLYICVGIMVMVAIVVMVDWLEGKGRHK